MQFDRIKTPKELQCEDKVLRSSSTIDPHKDELGIELGIDEFAFLDKMESAFLDTAKSRSAAKAAA